MTITYRIASNYNDDLFNLVKALEGFKEYIHDPGEGVPTIGYGYALLEKRDGRWQLKQTLAGDLEAVGVQLTANDNFALQQIAFALNNGNVPAARNLIATYSFSPFIDEIAGRVLFDRSIADINSVILGRLDEYTTTANAELLLASMEGSKELMALASLAYNLPELIGKGLTTALLDGNRAEAWFEIRYNSNNGSLDNPQRNLAGGIAKRRYYESTVFGLYNDSHNVSTDEAKEIYRMLQLHRDKVMAYESRYSTQVDNANSDFGLLATQNPVLTLEQELTPSKTVINADLLASNPDNIVGDTGDNKNDAIHDSGSNDLILAGDGNDNVMKANGGDDVIDLGGGDDAFWTTRGASDQGWVSAFGADGRDYIASGNGQDIIQGGDGADGIFGAGGNDVLYGDLAGLASDFIAQGATQIGTGLQGEWMDAGDGDDGLMSVSIGIAANDSLRGNLFDRSAA